MIDDGWMLDDVLLVDDAGTVVSVGRYKHTPEVRYLEAEANGARIRVEWDELRRAMDLSDVLCPYP